MNSAPACSSAYQACLVYELEKRGLTVVAQVPVPLIYDGQQLVDVGYRIKAVEAIAPVHGAQLVSYLKLSGRRLGLLLHFNVDQLRDGIVRRITRL